MQTHHERVTKALDLLSRGLYPFVETELKNIYKEKWADSARASFRKDRDANLPHGDTIKWDAHALLAVMWDQWNTVFRNKLGMFERSLISELRDFRNQWAHQAEFDFDDAFRILDTVHRILVAVSADESHEIQKAKEELLREQFRDEWNRAARRKSRVRDKWETIVIYSLCGTAIIYQISDVVDIKKSWFLMACVACVFIYLIIQRIKPDPVIIGPHECTRCGKIIYGDSCPYCESSKATPEAPA